MRRSAFIALALLLVSPAVAATAVWPTVEALARSSGAVVRARVVGQTSRWTAGGRRLVTDVEIEVTELLRGHAPDRLLVTVPGGEIDGIGQRVDGAPALGHGEDVILFLARRSQEWRLVGLALGTFKISAERATPGTDRFQLVTRPAAAGETLVGPLSVEELRHRVGQVR